MRGSILNAVIKQRKCKAPGCDVMYTPYSTLSHACSGKCALVLVKIANEKKWRKEHRECKKALKTIGEHTKDAQVMFNRWIVHVRDKDLPCISCGRHHKGQYDAGHYRSTKTHPALRFNENNAHKQCSPCNRHLSGNIVEYRINLVEKIGLDSVVELEGVYEPKHYTIPDIQEIRETYRLKIKEQEKT